MPQRLETGLVQVEPFSLPSSLSSTSPSSRTSSSRSSLSTRDRAKCLVCLEHLVLELLVAVDKLGSVFALSEKLLDALHPFHVFLVYRSGDTGVVQLELLEVRQVVTLCSGQVSEGRSCQPDTELGLEPERSVN